MMPRLSVAGLPAVSVPLGAAADSGLPVGLQFLGGWWAEATLA